MVGMEDGVFPHFRSMTDTDELEEERRLGVRRDHPGPQRLYLTPRLEPHALRRPNYNPPSRFLGEIPEALLDAKESETRVQRRASARRSGGGGSGGYSVVGLPGRSDAVEVEPGWTPGSPAGAPKRDAPAIVAGDTVQHERWGEGVVATTNGYGDDAEATIRFGEVGRSACCSPTRRCARSASAVVYPTLGKTIVSPSVGCATVFVPASLASPRCGSEVLVKKMLMALVVTAGALSIAGGGVGIALVD